jgi:Glycosyltransferase family 87
MNRDTVERWLNRERLVAWSAAFLVVEATALALIMLHERGVILPGRSSAIDFVSFYAAGKLTLAGTPALAYNHAAHYLAEQQATAFGTPYVFFFYPPVFLMICAALATLPYLLAYAVWQAATFALFALVLRRVLGARGWTGVLGARGWTSLIPVLAFPATFWTIGMGQNTFLTTALLGGFTLLVDRRPRTAGALMGALCFKPHLGLLAPVALAGGRRWAAFAAASATLAALVALSALAFGWGTWRAYLTAMAGASGVYASGQVSYGGFVTIFGAVKLLGYASGTAYIAQAIAALLAAVLVFVVWRRNGGQAERSAVLLSMTLLAVPLGLLYDQLLLVVAVAWLLRDGPAPALSLGEKLLLIAAYPLALVAIILALGDVPAATAISVAVAALCVRRAWRAGPVPSR